MLTKQEITDICLCVADLESGNHLLRPRTDKQRKLMSELCGVLDKVYKDQPLNAREADIYNEYKHNINYPN